MASAITDERSRTSASQISEINEALSELVGPQKFRIWFKNSTNMTLADGYLKVGVPNLFIANWIENHFIKEIQILEKKTSNPELFLPEINKLAREFFVSKFEVDGTLKYSDLSEQLKKMDTKAAVFCNKMQRALYAGETITENETRFLLKTIKDLVESSILEEKESNKIINKLGDENKLKEEQRIEKEQGKQIEEKTGEVDKEKTESLEEDKITNLEQIKANIREGLDRGLTLEKIKSKLIQANFDENAVHNCINDVRSHIEEKKHEARVTHNFISKIKFFVYNIQYFY